jgi:hypothetical protein
VRLVGTRARRHLVDRRNAGNGRDTGDRRDTGIRRNAGDRRDTRIRRDAGDRRKTGDRWLRRSRPRNRWCHGYRRLRR